MPPISVGTSTTSSSQATCFQIPLQMLEQYMSHGQFQEVQDLLFARFRYAQSEQEVEECYQLLFKLLPHCTPLGVLENNLTNLLDKSASLAKEQEQLALLLGQRYLQEKELKKAMLCFAKALQMNRSQDNYSAASQVFLQYFEMQKEEHLKLFLENAIPSLDTMDFHVKRIEALKAFGISKEILMPFFLKITNRVNNIHCDDQAKYRPCEKTSQEMLNSSWELDQTAVERYWDALQKFRACFACQDASKIQEKTFKAMKELIALCIEDISILIGPPPCHYDFRAMGSLARKEMCPYSDLECMLLIEDNQYRPYFNRMLHLLELQMASFGETQGLGLVFTCISHPSGLHLDKPPLEETRLMQTPEQMALLQKSEAYDVVCINVLKAISLYQTTPQLDTDYKEHVQSIRNEFSFPFFDVCKQRIHDFSFAWRKHFDWTHFTDFTYDIKEKFVETLYHPLSDLAVYLRIESTNTLEIADVLIDRKVLPENMRDLLKESILLIYQIRVRNHQKYRTQEEKVNLTPSEIETLEKCYWQILIPLHTCFKKLTDSKEPHRQYFENLCKIDDSEVLLKQLKGSASILDAVLRLPDSSTTRPIYTIKMDALQGSITAITSPSSPSAPGEISVQIKSPHFRESRFLPYDLIKKIMEGFNLKQQYTNSAHRVCRLQYGMRDLHLKQTPSNPLMEYAIYSLVSRIAGEYTPPSTLVRFDVEQQGQKKSYPVLICQTISGENLKTAWSKATANRSYTWNLLAAILTKPQDGRFSNYVLHEQDLVCVDNDLAFVEPVTSSLFGMSRAVHFSAAPFCLFPLDTPLDKGV
ncbi:MAG: DUF294 nucleotidyltransferase-like domain-containing protein, partial [Parachlamydiaceae bacterium]